MAEYQYLKIFVGPAAFYCLPIVASPRVGIIKFVVYLFLLVVQVDIFLWYNILIKKINFEKHQNWKRKIEHVGQCLRLLQSIFRENAKWIIRNVFYAWQRIGWPESTHNVSAHKIQKFCLLLQSKEKYQDHVFCKPCQDSFNTIFTQMYFMWFHFSAKAGAD